MKKRNKSRAKNCISFFTFCVTSKWTQLEYHVNLITVQFDNNYYSLNNLFCLFLSAIPGFSQYCEKCEAMKSVKQIQFLSKLNWTKSEFTGKQSCPAKDFNQLLIIGTKGKEIFFNSKSTFNNEIIQWKMKSWQTNI